MWLRGLEARCRRNPAEAYWRERTASLPSWVTGDLVRQAGYAELLYRSARDPQHLCLVLYSE
jgi:hypothetical protein